MKSRPRNTCRWIDREWPGEGRPDHRVLDHAAHDLMELGDPPQRRFHMSMMDNGRRRITVLSALRDGLFRNVRNSEQRRWTGLLGRAPLALSRKTRVFAAVEEAAAQWLEREIKRPDSMLRVQALSSGQQDEAARLLLELPYAFFRGDPGNVGEDRAMVAESIVTGKRLVISENRKSIRQASLNRWLKEAQWIKQERWIRTTAEVLRALEPEVCEDVAYVWALGAFLPEAPSYKDVAALRHNAEVLARAGFGYAALRIEQELEADPDVGRTFSRMRRMFPRRARGTEMRRVQAVREAAESEGYAPPAPG